jgi:hypothetical protein
VLTGARVAGALVHDAVLVHEPFHDAPQLPRGGRRIDGARRQPHQLLAGVAEQPARGVVDGHETSGLAVGIQTMQVDRVVAGLEEEAVALLVRPQLPLHCLHVVHHILQPAPLRHDPLDRRTQADPNRRVGNDAHRVVARLHVVQHEEGHRGHEDRPQRGEQAAAHAAQIGPGDDERHAQDLDRRLGQQQGERAVQKGDSGNSAIDAHEVQSGLLRRRGRLRSLCPVRLLSAQKLLP